MSELRELIEQASAMADTFFESTGQMLAHILAIDPAGKPVLLAAPMANREEELVFRVAVPEGLRRMGFRRWCFFTEAWAAEYTRGDSPEVNLPRDRADRMEIVTFAAELASGKRMLASRQIYRPAPGAPGRIMPLVFPKGAAAFVTTPAEAARAAARP